MSTLSTSAPVLLRAVRPIASNVQDSSSTHVRAASVGDPSGHTHPTSRGASNPCMLPHDARANDYWLAVEAFVGAVLSERLEKLHAALAVEARTTAQLAIACKWSLDAAFAKLVELERLGIVARDSSRPINSAALKWRLVSAAALTTAIERASGEQRLQPSAEPESRAWGDSTEPELVSQETTRSAPADDINPYEAPAEVAPKPPEDIAQIERQRRFDAKGNFWLGFAAGIVVGPIAYILTTSSAPQTNKGASWGAATQFTLFVIWRVVLA
jgi:hypothetical protein